METTVHADSVRITDAEHSQMASAAPDQHIAPVHVFESGGGAASPAAAGIGRDQPATRLPPTLPRASPMTWKGDKGSDSCSISGPASLSEPAELVSPRDRGDGTTMAPPPPIAHSTTSAVRETSSILDMRGVGARQSPSYAKEFKDEADSVVRSDVASIEHGPTLAPPAPATPSPPLPPVDRGTPSPVHSHDLLRRNPRETENAGDYQADEGSSRRTATSSAETAQSAQAAAAVSAAFTPPRNFDAGSQPLVQAQSSDYQTDRAYTSYEEDQLATVAGRPGAVARDDSSRHESQLATYSAGHREGHVLAPQANEHHRTAADDADMDDSDTDLQSSTAASKDVGRGAHATSPAATLQVAHSVSAASIDLAPQRDVLLAHAPASAAESYDVGFAVEGGGDSGAAARPPAMSPAPEQRWFSHGHSGAVAWMFQFLEMRGNATKIRLMLTAAAGRIKITEHTVSYGELAGSLRPSGGVRVLPSPFPGPVPLLFGYDAHGDPVSVVAHDGPIFRSVAQMSNLLGSSPQEQLFIEQVEATCDYIVNDFNSQPFQPPTKMSPFSVLSGKARWRDNVLRPQLRAFARMLSEEQPYILPSGLSAADFAVLALLVHVKDEVRGVPLALESVGRMQRYYNDMLKLPGVREELSRGIYTPPRPGHGAVTASGFGPALAGGSAGGGS